MALTRKYLTALGIEADKIDEIIEAHADTVNALKSERDEFKEKAEKLPDVEKKLEEATKTLEAKDSDEFESKYNELKKLFDDYKAEQEAKIVLSQKDSAYRALLRDAGVSEKRIDSIMKVTSLDEIILDGDKIKESEALTQTIREEWKDFLTTEQKEGASTDFPPDGNDRHEAKPIPTLI